MFERSPSAEHGVCGAGAAQCGVDHPAERLDPGAPQVVLQFGGLGDGGRLRERDDEDPAVVGVLQAHQRGDDAEPLADILHDLTVEGAGHVEQEQGVSRGCGVDDDEALVRPPEELPEGLEDGDLL